MGDNSGWAISRSNKFNVKITIWAHLQQIPVSEKTAPLNQFIWDTPQKQAIKKIKQNS
jgi:hypothetical protein